MNQAVSPKTTTRNRTLRWVRTLHVYSSMLMLLIMLFFTVTGLTLNHRDWLPDAEPAQVRRLSLPPALAEPQLWQRAPLRRGEAVRGWLAREYGVRGNQVSYDWLADEQLLLIDVKRPGGYSRAEVDVAAGELLLESRSFGTLATLNDLHRGRDSGPFWRLFIDLSALLMLLFTLTGFWLVLPQQKRRQRLLAMSALGLASMVGGYLLVLMA